MVIFWLLYYLIPGTLSKQDLWSSFYFSISTFTTLESPIPIVSVIGEVLAAIEGVIGYFMISLLVAILVRNTIGN